MSSVRTVITYGTFDLFHLGHLRILERSAALGERLVVGVSTDTFNQTKDKECVQPFEERSAIVGAMRVVSGVFAEDSWGQKRADIEREGADIFVMGDDWAGKFDDLDDVCEVVYLPRTEGVATTNRKELISSGVVSAADWSGISRTRDK